MRLREGLKLTLTDEGYIIYDSREERIIHLNITSSYLLEMMLDGKAEEEVVEEYSRAFGVSVEVARRDLERFLLMMRKEGLVED